MNTIYDQLGLLKAQISELQAQERALKADVVNAGSGEGQFYSVNVSTAMRPTVDYKAICAHLKPSRQLMTAHTITKPVTVVRCSARKVAA